MISSSRRRAVLLTAPVAIGVAVLAGCGGSSSTSAKASSSASSSSASSASADPNASPSGVPAATSPVKQTKVGVSVTGNLGDKPALTVPGTAAPTTLTSEVITQGTGPVVAKGETLVANYLGETWLPKDGKVNIFDNSYDRGAPAAFAIGTGQVIKGWDDTLVGQKAGSRLLLTIPAAKAYGTASPTTDNPLAGQTLLFVVDVLGGLDKNASASGTPVTPIPAGFPKVTSAPGKQPVVTSVAGVTVGAAPASTLLLKGTGPAIDAKKSLAMQIVQTDTATGKKTQATWGQALQVVPASNVLTIATALTGAPVGSRVLVVTPKTASAESAVLVLDVVGQY